MLGGEHELEQWRKKYYDSLSQLEHKEKEWKRTENVLRLCISRLTLAADGHGREFDRQLERLREALRKEVDSVRLESLLQSLSEQLLQLDEQRRTQNKPLSGLAVLHGLLEQIDFPRGLGHRAKKLARQVSKAKEEDSQAQLQAVTQLIIDAFSWLSERSAKEQPPPAENGNGLLKRWLQNDSTKPESLLKQAAQDTNLAEPDLSLAKAILLRILTAMTAPSALRDRVQEARKQADLQQATAELLTLFSSQAVEPSLQTTPQEVLLQLLERLAVPHELLGAMEKIKARLDSTLSAEELAESLEHIAELIANMRTRAQSECSEVEAFLKQLTQNLRELDASLHGTLASHRSSAEDGRSLDSDVQVQMKGIEDSVQSAQDLEHLKQSVQERISTIRRRMELFRRSEDERIERAEQEVEKLTARMHVLEAETESLRESMVQERNQALMDPLTEIPNRLAYDVRIGQEFARWQRYHSSLVLTVWDVDHFKRINDTYGHQAGDKVLKVVARLLAGHIRTTDFIARYGGEEFVILLPETTLVQARAVTEKIRLAVQNCDFHYRDETVRVTISCGIAEFKESDTPEQVFARADAALYRAKAAGRNCCREEAL